MCRGKIVKKFCFFFILAGLSCFLGCDFIYRKIHKEGAEEKELVGEVLPFEKNRMIEDIQNLLKLYGYNPGKVDGVWGARTREALARFQKENGINESRLADHETWAKLKVFKDNDLIVDGELNSLLIQKILVKAGFSPGKIDGKYGTKTESAIKVFQREYELKVDGKIGYKTLTKLSMLLPLEIEAEE